MFITPSNGNKINGIKAVTAIGTASVTHQVIIHMATAITLSASGETYLCGIVSSETTNSKGPKINPMTCTDRAKFTRVRVQFDQNYLFWVPIQINFRSFRPTFLPERVQNNHGCVRFGLK